MKLRVGRKAVFHFFVVLALSVVSLPATGYSEAEAPTVYVKEFRLVQNNGLDSGTVRSALKLDDRRDREYSQAELMAVVNEVTAFYHSSGYLLAKAYLPEQEIEGGVVIIAVSEGVLGSVDVSGATYYREDYVRSWFSSLAGKPVKEAEVKRAILLLNDTQGLKASTVFKKGEAAGTTDLAVNVEDNAAVDMSIEYNNHGHPLVDRDRYTLNIKATDPVLGSTLTLSAVTGDHVDETFYGFVDYNIPVGRNGTKLGVSYLNADYLVGGALQALGIQGESEVYRFYGSHACIRSDVNKLDVSLGLEVRDSKEYVLSWQKSHDELSALFLKVDYDGYDGAHSGRNYLSFKYTHGFDDFLGSLKKGEDSSRFNSDNEYDKINIDYVRLQRLWDEGILLFRASGQYAFSDRLVSAELFSIGGAGSVRGYGVSRYMGDNGYIVSAEVNTAIPGTKDVMLGSKSLAESFKLAAFIDHGGVDTEKPVFGEEKSKYLTTAGLGVRLYLFDRLTVKYDWAKPIDDHDTPGDKDSIHYIQTTLDVVKF